MNALPERHQFKDWFATEFPKKIQDLPDNFSEVRDDFEEMFQDHRISDPQTAQQLFVRGWLVLTVLLTRAPDQCLSVSPGILGEILMPVPNGFLNIFADNVVYFYTSRPRGTPVEHWTCSPENFEAISQHSGILTSVLTQIHKVSTQFTTWF